MTLDRNPATERLVVACWQDAQPSQELRLVTDVERVPVLVDQDMALRRVEPENLRAELHDAEHDVHGAQHGLLGTERRAGLGIQHRLAVVHVVVRTVEHFLCALGELVELGELARTGFCIGHPWESVTVNQLVPAYN